MDRQFKPFIYLRPKPKEYMDIRDCKPKQYLDIRKKKTKIKESNLIPVIFAAAVLGIAGGLALKTCTENTKILEQKIENYYKTQGEYSNYNLMNSYWNK